MAMIVALSIVFLMMCGLAAWCYIRFQQIETRQNLIFQRFAEAGADIEMAESIATDVRMPAPWVEYDDDDATTGVRRTTMAEPWN